jgi:hypothetical protein
MSIEDPGRESNLPSKEYLDMLHLDQLESLLEDLDEGNSDTSRAASEQLAGQGIPNREALVKLIASLHKALDEAQK